MLKCVMLTALVLVLLCRQDIICARCVQYVWAAAVRAPHRRPQESIRAAGITCWVASCLVCHRDWRSLAPPFPPSNSSSRSLSVPFGTCSASVCPPRSRGLTQRPSEDVAVVSGAVGVGALNTCIGWGLLLLVSLTLTLTMT